MFSDIYFFTFYIWFLQSFKLHKSKYAILLVTSFKAYFLTYMSFHSAPIMNCLYFWFTKHTSYFIFSKIMKLLVTMFYSFQYKIKNDALEFWSTSFHFFYILPLFIIAICPTFSMLYLIYLLLEWYFYCIQLFFVSKQLHFS